MMNQGCPVEHMHAAGSQNSCEAITCFAIAGAALAIGLAAFAVAYKSIRHSADIIGVASSASTKSNVQGQVRQTAGSQLDKIQPAQ